MTELRDAKVTCDPHEYNNFPIPDGQTCGGYAAKFMETAPGYIRDLNATGSCDYCAYSVGDEFFGPLGLEYDNRWRDLGILIAFIGSNLVFFFGGEFLLDSFDF